MHCCPNCGVSLRTYEAEDFTYGNVTCTVGYEIIFKGQKLNVFPSARKLCDALIRAKGRVLSRSDLLDIMGTDEDTEMRAIDVYVKRARAAFREIDPDFDQIVTIYGVGYRFDKKAEAPKLALAA